MSIRRLLTFAAFLSMTLFSTQGSEAAIITVTNANDSGPGSLRQAIINAAPAGGDTIVFDPGISSINLSSEIVISKNLTIAGPGARKLLICGLWASRIFNIASSTTVEISGLRLIDAASAISGGALENAGNVYLYGVTIGGCSASDYGGAIHNYGGFMAIYDSTLSGNSATNGGGAIFNDSSSTLIINNSTISGNTSDQGGAIANLGTIRVFNTTLTQNNSTSAAIDSAGTELSLYNSIIAGNNGKDLAGTPTHARYNLIENQILGTLGSDALGNIQGSAPLLSALGDNGGPTDTHRPLPGSPAFNAAELAFCGSADQRGYTRLRQGGCDIGAIEVGPPLLLQAGNQVSTVAGVPLSSGGTNGLGSAAKFNQPNGITSDGTNLYVADSGNNLIRNIVIATGEVTTLAGNGVAIYADGIGTSASFNSPYGMVASGSTVYVADTYNNRIRQIDTTTGSVSSLAGDGAMSSVDATCATSSFNHPAGLALARGYLFVSEIGSHRIRKINLQNCGAVNAVSTLAGSSNGFADGSGSAAKFNSPYGLATDAISLFVADFYNNRIRKIDIATGMVSTLAGNGNISELDGIGTTAQLGSPYGVVLDQDQLYVSDYGQNTLRRIDLSTAEVITIAGQAGSSGSVDGNNLTARFNAPSGIVHDGKSLFIAEAGNHTVRKMANYTVVSGHISTDTTWTKAGGTYYVTKDIIVDAFRTLTIAEGTVVKFAASKGIVVNVYGTLNAIGTAADKIYFTDYRDDSVGGDTNGDGPSAGAPGWWHGISVNDGQANFDYIEIRYAGSFYSAGAGSSPYFGLQGYGSSAWLHLTNSVISDTLGNAFYSTGSAMASVITDNTFRNSSRSGFCTVSFTVSGDNIQFLRNLVTDGAGCGVNVVDTALYFDNNTISNHAGVGSTGLYISNPTIPAWYPTNICNNNIFGNYIGIEIAATAKPALNCWPTYGNNIYNNTLYSVLNGTSLPELIDAKYNFWGDATGPYNATTNPDGNVSSRVSDNVDYLPFRTTTFSTIPNLSVPTFENIWTNQATLVLKSGGTGTGYFTLLNGHSAICGTGAQVAAGKTVGDSPAPYFGSLPLDFDTAGRYTIRNLTQSTDYTICFTADSPVGSNLNPVPASFNLSTLPPTALTSPNWSLVGSAGFSAGEAVYSSLAFDPYGTPYVAYSDGANSYKATVMKYLGGSWSVVGGAGFSAGQADHTSLAFAPDGTPYVAYKDLGNSNKATVMKFDGTNWVAVGSAGFSAASTGYTSLAFAPDGAPYVAFLDNNNAFKATVMKFNGSSWVTVGSPGFSAGQASFDSLAFAPDGTPYLAYMDWGNSNKATVKKFDGTNWVTVGSVGFSPGEADYTSMAIAPDGTPFVAYMDLNNSQKATVMKFNGTSWVPVGSAGFSAAQASYTRMAFTPDGTPVVAYRDVGNSSKSTVMKFNGTNWVTVGSAGFSAGESTYVSMAFAPDGTPFVAYKDYGNSTKASVMAYVIPPTISGTPAASAFVGTPYSFTPTAANAATFSIIGILPPGLGFDTITGTLSGTPTTLGTYSNIIITATNATGSASLSPFTITVAAADATPPTVSSTSPANSATGIAPNSNVTITWSENIDCTTVNTTNITMSSGGWAFSGCSANQAVFTTSSQSNLTAYTVTVGTGVKDLAGNAMASSYTSSYTTAAGVKTWNGGTGTWNTPANWSPAGVPTTTDDVIITASGNYTVTLDINPTVAGMTIGGVSGTQTLFNGTLTLNGPGSITGNVTFSGITVNGTSTLTNTAGKTLSLANAVIACPLDNAGILTTTANGFITSGVGQFTTQPTSDIRMGSATNLTIANGFTNNGAITLTNNSGGSWRMTVTNGTLVNAPGKTITIDGTGTGSTILDSTLDNQGTITNNHPVGWIYNAKTVNNSSSGSIVLNNDTTLQIAGSFTNTGSITAAAGKKLMLTVGTLVHDIGSSMTGLGTLEIAGSNTLTLNSNYNTANLQLSLLSNSTVNGTGTLTNAAGKTLNLAGATIACQFDNAGILTTTASGYITSGVGKFTTQSTSVIGIGSATSLTVTNGFSNNGAITLTNNSAGSWRMTVTNGTLINAPGATITINGSGTGSTILEGTLDNQGTVTNNHPVGWIYNASAVGNSSSGSIILNNDTTLQIAGSFTNTGSITAAAGKKLMLTVGTLIHGVGSNMTGPGTLEIGPGKTFTLNSNYSTANLPLSLLGSATINGTGTLTNASGNSLNLAGATIACQFDNAGILTTTANSSISSGAGKFTTQGTSDIQVGSGNILTITNSFTNNGVIRGTGTVTVPSLSNAANITPANAGTAGKLSITGTLPDTAAAITNIDIGGTTAVTQYDQIAVSGAATLAGTLNVSLVNSFTPGIGDSFTIMTFASHTGSFATTNLPALPADRKWVVTYNAANVTLNVASTTITWLAAVSGNWNDGTKWSGGIVPTSVDDAVITVPGTYTVTLNTSPTVSSLNLGGTSGPQTLAMSGNTLTLNNVSSVNANGIINQSGGTIAGAGTLTINGTYNWSGGFMSGSGITSIAPGATLNISTASAYVYLDSGRILNNSGTVTFTGNGYDFYLQNGTTINNLAGGLFDAQNDKQINYGGSGPNIFNNAGTFRKSAGTGTTTVGVPFNNTGTLDVQTSFLSLSNGGTSTGSFNTASGATLRFPSGTHNLNAGSSVTGAGTLDFAGSATVNINGSYNLTGITSIPSGAVNFNSPATIATLNFSGGTISGSGTVTVSGAANWSGGTMTGTGVTTIAPGATLVMSSAGTNVVLDGGRTLNNSGTATLSGSGINFWIQYGSTFNNLAGAVFDIQNDRPINGAGTGPNNFNNSGTFRKSAGTGTTALSMTFNNSGTVDLQTGTISLANGGTDTGSFNAASGTKLQFAGGTHNLNAGSSIVSPGTVDFNSGTMNINGIYNVTGTTSFTSSATANFNAAATVTSVGNTLTITGGTANLSSGEAINVATLNMSGGYLSGTDIITVSGAATWSNGTMNGTGVTTIAPGATLNMNSTGTNVVLDSGRTLSNYGTATFSGSGINFWIQYGSTFNNLAGGVFDVQNDRPINGAGTGPNNFNNSGTFRKSAGTGTTTLGMTFINSGTMDVQSGIVSVTGTLATSVTNLAIGGTTAGTQYDQIAVTGAATLAGTLNISLINSFVPNIGDSFIIITFASHAGTFATTNLPALPADRKWVVTYNTANVTLNVASTTISWSNNAGGNWNTPANWTPPIVPTSLDNVVIGGAASFTVTMDTSPTINSLNLGGGSGIQALSMNANTLTLNSASTVGVNGVLNQTGGTIAGAGLLTINGTYNFSCGTMLGTGVTAIAPGATLNLSATCNAMLSGRTIDNHGTAILAGAYSLDSQSGSVFNNYGTLDIQSDHGLYNQAGTNTLNNSGLLKKSAGTGTSAISIVVNNTGNVDIQSGTLSFSGGGTDMGSYSIASGAKLQINGGTRNLNAGSNITGAGTMDVTTGTVNSAGTYSINTLNLATGATANFNSNGTIATFNQTGGTLGGTGTITLTGPSSAFACGTMLGTGVTSVAPGATLNLSTTCNAMLSGRTIDNHGTAVIAGAYYLNSQSSSVFNNYGTLDFQSDQGFFNQAGTNTLNNSGLLKKSGVTGNSATGIVFNNTGSVDIQTGTLSFSGNGTDTGSYSIAAGTKLQINGGTRNLNAGSNITGAGTMDVSTGTVNIGGTYSISAFNLATGGTANFNSNGTIATFNQTGGTLGGTGTITLTGPSSAFACGFMQGTGVTSVAPGATLNLSTTCNAMLSGRTIDNHGTAILAGAYYLNNQSSSVFNNYGTLDLQSDQGFFNQAGINTLNNSGLLKKSAGTGTSAIGIVFNNTGTIDLTSGILSLTNAAGLTTGITDIAIGGTTAGTQYSQIQKTGTATLAGTLNVSLINSFVPAINDSFIIMTFASKTGTFATTNLPALPADRKWVVTYNSSNVTLSVVSTTVTWNGGSGNWSVASNWTPPSVPTPLDNVVIGGAATYTVTLDTSPTVNSINLGGGSGTQTLSMSNNTLTLNSASSVNANGIITMTSGTLTGTGTLTFNSGAIFNWSGGTISGTGATTIAAGAALNINPSNGILMLDTRTLNNSGTVTYGTGPNWVRLQNGAVFNNQGLFDIQNDRDISVSGTPPSFNNSGTFRKSIGTGTSSISVPFNNSGTVDIQSGIVSFAGGGTSSGAFTVSSGNTVRFAGATHDLNAASSIAGSGIVELYSGSVNMAGTYNAAVTIKLTGGTVNFNSNGSVAAINLDSGTIGGTGTVNITGTGSIWSGGTMSGTGATTIAAGAALNINPANGILTLDTRTLTNAGTVIYGTGPNPFVRLQNGAVFNNQGLFDIQSDKEIIIGGTAPSFNNSGIFKKSAGAGTFAFGAAFNNSGTVDIQSGIVSFAGGGTSSGTFTVTSGNTIRFAGGTHDLTAGSSIAGSGVVEASSGIANIAGNYNAAVTAKLTGGTVNFNSSGSIAAFNMDSGAIGGTGTVTITGTGSIWSGGTMIGTGATTIASGAVLSINPSNGILMLDTRTLNNSGTVTYGTGPNWVRLQNGAVFNNLGLFDIQNDRDISVSGAPPSFNNSGIFKKSAGTGTSPFGALFNNSGIVDAQSGTISYTSSFTNTGTAILGGPTAATTGKISTAGALTLNGTNTVNIDLGGTTAGTQYDQIAVSGAAALAGTLNVGLINGFTPNIGDSFNIISYGTSSGSFTGLNLQSPGAGKAWSINYGPRSSVGNLTLTVVADVTGPTDGILTAVPGNGQMDLSWSGFSDSGSGIASYTLVYDTTAMPATCATGIQLYSGPLTTFSQTPLTSGTYYYRVCSTDNAGNTSTGATLTRTYFYDDFSGGVNGWHWTQTSNQPLFTMDAAQGDIRFAKPTGGSGSEWQSIYLFFNHEVRGDFDISVDYRNAAIAHLTGSFGNAIVLSGNLGSQWFSVTRSDETNQGGNTYYNWVDPPGTVYGTTVTSDTAGTLRFTRTGTTVSAYANGAMLHQGAYNNSSATNLNFYLTYKGTTDPISVIFDNFTIAADDIVIPAPFTFTPVTGVALSSQQTSNSITVSGIKTNAAIAVTGGEYEINNSGTWLTTAGTVNLNDTVKVRHSAAATANSLNATSLNIGGTVGTFTSTTSPDSVGPTGSIAINGGAAYTKTSATALNLTCADAGSGCSQMQISADNFATSSTYPFATSQPWALTAGEGLNTVFVKFQDNAGNWSTPYTATITLDTTPPTVSAISPANNATGAPLNGNVTITWSENIDCATVNTSNVTINSGGLALSSCTGNQAVFTASGQANATAYTATVAGVKDLAGNAMAAPYPFNYTTETTCAAAPSGLVGWWKGDGNADDQTGANDGTLVGGATTITSGSRQAFSFDGVNDSVDIPSNSNLNPGTGSFTVELWVKPNSLAWSRILMKGNVNPADYYIATNNGDSLVAEIGGTGSRTSVSYTGATTGTWYHVALVRDTTLNQVNLYVNGALGQSSQTAVDISGDINNTAPLTLGRNSTVPAEYFSGAIDEAKYYDHALTASDILNIYNAGTNSVCTTNPATVSLSNLTQTYDGTPKAPTATTTPPGLNVTYSYIPASPIDAGAYTVTANIVSPIYNGSTSGPLTIAKATPVITWTNPADITFGTPLSATQLNASSGGVAGTFIYTPASGTVLSAGAAQTLSVSFTPTDTANYNTPAVATALINVTAAAQSAVIVSAPTSALFGQTGLTASASGGSGTGAYSYDATGSTACTVNALTGVISITSGTGSCSITATRAADTDFALSAPSSPATIAISPASQTIIFGTAPSLTYGGGNGTVSATGGVSGSPVTFSSLTPAVCTIIGTTVTPVSAVTCTIAADQAGNTNYSTALQVTQSFTIAQAAQMTLTVTGLPASAAFGQGGITASTSGGSGSGAISFSAGASTACSVNTSTGAVTITSGSGSCAITATKAADTNYTAVTSAAASIAAITPASQTITVFAPPATATYGAGPISLSAIGGASSQPVTFSIVSGPGSITGNSLTITGAGTISLKASQAGDANYSAASDVPASVTVNPATLTVTGLAASSRQYDGTTNVTLSGGTLAGIINSDNVSILSASGSFTDKNVGTSKPVTISGVTLTGANAGNYIVTSPTAITATVSAAPLTVTGMTASSRIYDGTSGVTLSGGILAGIFSPDVVSIKTRIGSFGDKQAGTTKPVTVSHVSLSGIDAGNYTVTNPTGITADITPRTLIVTAAGVDKTYDGLTSASVTLSDNRIAGDILSSSYSTATFADRNSGAGKAVSVTGTSISGSDVANYSLASSSTAATANINAAPLTVTGMTAGSRAYDGTTNVTLSGGTLGGIIGTDTVTIDSRSGSFADKNAGVTKPVTVTSVTLTGTDAGNYLVTNQAGITADITPAPLTITANSFSKIFGQTHTFSGTEFTSTGLQDSETISSVTLASAGAAPDATAAGGPYPITVSAATGGTFISANYSIIYKPGALTVTQSTLTITATAATGGAITPAGTTNVNLGADQKCTITPDSGYFIADVKVDGISKGALSSYSFTNVTVSHTIEALFSKPDGILDPANTTGTPGMHDALIALTFAVGEAVPTAEQLRRGDASPMINGVPHPDGKIDLGDVLVILRKVVGLAH